MTTNMTAKLPPLNALKAFVATAKHQSFTKAAAELGVTQGAISKQIATLEDYLQLNLFERNQQQIKLNNTTKKYYNSINKAFKIIEQSSTRLIKKPNKEIININILPSLSNQWLLPRLKNFKTANPHYQINLSTGSSTDLSTIDSDITIRIAKKNMWRNYHVNMLIREHMLCVCSPEFLQKCRIKNISDLLNYTLLHHTNRPNSWVEYFKFHNITKLDKLQKSDGFERIFMIIKAAKEGEGIALIPDFLITKELEKGQLIPIFNNHYKSGYNYYLIYSRTKSYLQKIGDFKEWIENEFKKKSP